MKDKLELLFQNTMDERGVLPVRASNKKTLRWLEKRGCIASWESNHKRYWHPVSWVEARGLDGIQSYFTLRTIFTVWDGDSGQRSPRPPFEWIKEGTIIEIRCRQTSAYRRRPGRFCDHITIWVPKDLADKALAFGHIP